METVRFIPAGAGNSFIPSLNALMKSVYPRWRGELTITRHYRHWLLGLSPLARGTHQRWRGGVER